MQLFLFCFVFVFFVHSVLIPSSGQADEIALGTRLANAERIFGLHPEDVSRSRD